MIMVSRHDNHEVALSDIVPEQYLSNVRKEDDCSTGEDVGDFHTEHDCSGDEDQAGDLDFK